MENRNKAILIYSVILLVVFVFFPSTSKVALADYKEKMEDNCRLKFTASEIEFAYASCWVFDEAKGHGEYRILEDGGLVIWSSFHEAPKGFYYTVQSNSSYFEAELKRFGYLSDNWVGSALAKPATIKSKIRTKVHVRKVSIQGMNECLGFLTHTGGGVDRDLWPGVALALACSVDDSINNQQLRSYLRSIKIEE